MQKYPQKQGGSGKSAIPDRWLDYKAIGSVVASTSFVPFKVPLHESICSGLPELERLTTRHIINALPNVGLIINLTNTQTGAKYYQPRDWASNGIDYRWIKVRGHVTPSQQLLVDFCRTVKKFMAENPTKLIGIHCTHGLNRTGYFICSYMVLVMNLDPDDAIQRFNEARGYNIERENYLSSIKSFKKNRWLKNALSRDEDMSAQSTQMLSNKRKYSTREDGNKRARTAHIARYYRNLGGGSSWRSGSNPNGGEDLPDSNSQQYPQPSVSGNFPNQRNPPPSSSSSSGNFPNQRLRNESYDRGSARRDAPFRPPARRVDDRSRSRDNSSYRSSSYNRSSRPVRHHNNNSTSSQYRLDRRVDRSDER